MMLPLDETVEAEKVQFLQELQTRFPSIDIEEIAIAAANLEQLAEVKIFDRVLSNIGRILSDPQMAAIGTQFILTGHRFEMSFATDLTRGGGDSLIYSCMCRSVDAEEMGSISVEVPLDEPVRYRTVIFMFPAIAKTIDEPFLHALVSGIFGVAYNWLIDALGRAIADATAKTNQDLYRFVRVMIPDQKVLEGFIFSVLIQGKGAPKAEDVVILNDQAASLSIKLASERSRRLGRNPADLAVEMLSELVPYNDSVIPNACAEGKPVDISLKSEKYYQESMTFNEAMQAIWGSTVTCYPIVTDGEFLLVAFYQTQYKNILTPFVGFHKSRLAEMATAKTDRIRKGLDVMRSIKKKPDLSSASIWAEIAGRFTGGIIHAIHH